MVYLFGSILSSTLIYLLFKLFARYGVQTLQAIVINYWVALAFGLSLVSKEQILTYSTYNWKWLVPIEGLLFITIFSIMAMTVQKHSVTVASIASRTAMIIPFAVFMVLEPEEKFSGIKVLGIAMACLAVFLSSRKGKNTNLDNRYLYLPLVLFIGAGMIDLIIGYAQHYLMKDSSEILIFTPSIFLVASIIGTAVLIYRYRVRKDIKWQFKDLIAGIALGFVNYSSLFCILQAMHSKVLSPTVFFPVNHMGIIAAGTLVGLIVFREKLSKINLVGIGLGLLAILIMTTD